METKAIALEEASARNDVGSWQTLVRPHWQKTHSLCAVYFSSAQVINTEGECTAHWSEHFSQPLNAPPISVDPDIKAAAKLTHSAHNDPGKFTVNKIHRDVRKLQGNKATGICGNPAELLKNAGPAIFLWLQILFNIIWRTELIPSNWQTGIILPRWELKGSK